MGKDKKGKEKDAVGVEEVDESIANKQEEDTSEREHKKKKKSKDKRRSESLEQETEKVEDEEESEKKKKKRKRKSKSDSESPEELESAVHSFNDWEHADLGDDERKDKFLKLMGAKKTEHHGKIVIGEPTVENQHKGDDPNLNKKLENQFQQGLEHKLKSGWKGHLGLGCHAEDSPAAAGEKRKDESGDTDGKDQPTAKKKFMMNFVKSSDS